MIILVLLFSYNMLTKEEVVEMLANDCDIQNHLAFRSSFEVGNLFPVSQEDTLLIFLRCINAQEKIIQHVLSKLDEIDTPTETTSL